MEINDANNIIKI